MKALSLRRKSVVQDAYDFDDEEDVMEAEQAPIASKRSTQSQLKRGWSSIYEKEEASRNLAEALRQDSAFDLSDFHVADEASDFSKETPRSFTSKLESIAEPEIDLAKYLQSELTHEAELSLQATTSSTDADISLLTSSLKPRPPEGCPWPGRPGRSSATRTA